MWLPLTCSLLGTWPATQARAPTGNLTGDLLVRRLALNPLSYTWLDINSYQTKTEFIIMLWTLESIFIAIALPVTHSQPHVVVMIWRT